MKREEVECVRNECGVKEKRKRKKKARRWREGQATLLTVPNSGIGKDAQSEVLQSVSKREYVSTPPRLHRWSKNQDLVARGSAQERKTTVQTREGNRRRETAWRKKCVRNVQSRCAKECRGKQGWRTRVW